VKDDITVEHLSATKEEDLNSILDRLGIHGAFGTRIRFKQAWNMLGKTSTGGSSFFRRKSVTVATEVISSSSQNIEHHQLEFTKEIGQGGSGQVYRGLFRGVKVAIKVLKNEEKIKKELEILNAVNSPYIIRFYGVCMKPNVCVVMEYACKGSLYQVLHRDMEISWGKGLKFAGNRIIG
jgi:serine/threonine protein kinase